MDPSQQSALSHHRWKRLWRWLWRGLCLVWSLIVIGVLVNIASTRLTSDKDIPLASPVGLALRNLPLTIALAIILFLFTLLVWMLSRQSAQADSPLPLPSQQNRIALVRMLRREYTKLLTYSLQVATMMMLDLHERTNITLSSAQLVFPGTEAAEEHPLPPGTSIVEAYDDSGQGLLILGEPGSGKTILLLDLARELLIRAEGDPSHPIPVIVNLSSWATKQPPLAAWLIDQLQLVYKVPTRLCKAWLEHDQWLLLLDGLDEVEASVRAACIEAINTYRGEHFAPLVVCSRTHDYLAQEARFALPSAVVVQPLQEQQVTEYLKRVGKPMSSVRAALRTNATLRQLITTPLMLSIVILTYRDRTLKDLPELGSTEEQHQQIFERYVERMLAKRTTGDFTPEQTRYWLTWLARQMKQHQLTEFYLERLQLNWLPSERLQMICKIFIKITTGLLFGLIGGLVAGLLFGLVSGLILGSAIALLYGLDNRVFTNPVDNLIWSWNRFWQGLRSAPRFTAFYGLVTGFFAGLPAGRHFGLIVGLLYGLVVWLVTVLAFGLLVGLRAGIDSSQINEHLHIRPNQGIRNSAWNALRISLIGFLISFLLYGLVFGLAFGLLSGLKNGLIQGSLFGLLLGLVNGGGICLQHYALRYILWRRGSIPWHYVSFLEEASGRILLQKVGGGYRFIHPLFLDFFASPQTEITSYSTQQPHLKQSSYSSTSS